jgi:hypothetical protein
VRAHWGQSVSAFTPHPSGLMPLGHDPSGGDAGRANFFKGAGPSAAPNRRAYNPSSEKARASAHMAVATSDVQSANVR